MDKPQARGSAEGETSPFAPRRAPVPLIVIGAQRRLLSKVLWRYFRHESKSSENAISGY